MPQERTDVVIKTRTEGLGQTGSDLQNLGQRGAASMAKVEKEVKRLDSTFSKLTDRQLELSKVMADIEDKASPAYRKLAKDMSAVQKEAAGIERTLKNVQRTYKETDATAEQSANKRKQQQQKQGAFTQGLAQGLIPEAAYLQRGPGMFRQAAGAAIGGRMRGAAGGMANMPFTGAAGLGQALQSIPGGGFLAMPLMQSMQYAQQSLQHRTQQQQLKPFLRMGMGTGGSRMAGETPEQQRARIGKGFDDQGPIKTARAGVSGLFTGERPLTGELDTIGDAITSKLFPQLRNRERAVRAASNEKMLEALGEDGRDFRGSRVEA